MKIPGYRSKKPWKMFIATVFYGFVLLILIIAIINPSSSPQITATTSNPEQKEVQSAAQPLEMPKPEIPKELTTQEFIEKIVTDLVGKTNRADVPRLKNVSNPEKNYWVIAMNLDDNFSNSLIKRGAYRHSKDIFKMVFERNDINEITLQWFFPLVDLKGNTKDTSVITLTLKRETASTIKWDNILTDNLPKIVDIYVEHPALKK